MKTIYWKGKIYEGVESDVPDSNNYLGVWCEEDSTVLRYDAYLAIFETTLLDTHSLPVSGTHDWIDWQEVVKGVDYNIINDPWCDVGDDGKLVGGYDAYATPIQKTIINK